MTTQDNDPFAATPQAAPPGTPEPAPTPPGVLAPGTLPGASPVAPPMPGAVGAPAAYPNYAPTAPASGLATGAIVATGAYTAVAVLSALLTPSIIDTLKKNAADPDNATIDFTALLIGSVSFFAAVAGYVLLAMWMWRIRKNLTVLGRAPGGPPAVEWWGWFVPVANFVLPALGMRAITKRFVGVGRLLMWWVPFAATFALSGYASYAQNGAFDFATGELVDESLLDSAVPLTYASTALVIVSWLFLVQIISKTTKEHVSNAQ